MSDGAITPTTFPFTTASATDASGATAVPLKTATRKLRLYNAGPNTVYFSTDTGVTTATGWPIANGETFGPVGKVQGAALSLYFVCTSTETASVRILEEF